ncbi:MAG: hypothetical protein M1815_004922 [Lichina confinis]|nr:MAG: hypothetical protein M1815_004922 [Lichina confinis]
MRLPWYRRALQFARPAPDGAMKLESGNDATAARKSAVGGPGRRAWSRRQKILLALVVALILVVALGVGLGVGLSRSSSDSDSDSDSGSDPDSASNSDDGKARPDGPTEIWRPEAGVDWHIVLLHALNDTSNPAPVYDIDLFTNDKSVIDDLHDMGRKVICYFSAGSYEDFRPDSDRFREGQDYANRLDGWDGEWWVDTRSANVRDIMRDRLDEAVRKGCDGVDPDNIDAYNNDSGLDLTDDDAADFVLFLADEGHARNLAVGLKNGGAIVDRVVDRLEWEVNEQCLEFNECDEFQPFIDAGKPVFHIEYPSDARSAKPDTVSSICDDDARRGFSTLIKELKLGNWSQKCD